MTTLTDGSPYLSPVNDHGEISLMPSSTTFSRGSGLTYLRTCGRNGSPCWSFGKSAHFFLPFFFFSPPETPIGHMDAKKPQSVCACLHINMTVYCVCVCVCTFGVICSPE